MTTRSSFSCGESLTIDHVQSMQARLQEQLAKSPLLELRADSIRNVDTAGLQLMLALSHEVHRLQGKIIWIKPSELLINAAQQLGVHKELALDESRKS